jgi:hypothetical protein
MSETVTELWVPVAGEVGYDVSSLGRVRSYWVQDRPGTSRLCETPVRILRPAKDRKGYLFVSLRGRTVKIARLVAAAFVGDVEGWQVNHLNGIKSDNHAVNLELVNQSANILHAYKHGLKKPMRASHCLNLPALVLTNVRGSSHPAAKLSEEKVVAIRQMAADGERYTEIASQFNVDPTLIGHVVRKRIWRHVA